jgi:hypothetical protein
MDSASPPSLQEKETGVSAARRIYACLRQRIELLGYPGIWPMVSQAKTQIDRYR